MKTQDFYTFRAIYKSRAHAKTLRPLDIVLYNAARELPLDRGFTPVTNSTKLSNGADPTFAYQLARLHARSLLRANTAFDQQYSGISAEFKATLLERLSK